MTSTAEVAGAVVGGIFGGLFLITCIISAVKAVKDRKRIKLLRAAKEEARRLARITRQAYDNIGGNTTQGPVIVNSGPCTSIEVPNNDYMIDNRSKPSYSNTNYNHDSPKSQNMQVNGNATEKYTKLHTNSMTTRNGNKPVVKTLSDGHPRNGTIKQTTFDIQGTTDGHIEIRGSVLNPSELQTESLAARKILRRHSYEVAVESFSCLQQETPKYAKADTIMAVYKAKPSSIAYENRAFDPENMKYI